MLVSFLSVAGDQQIPLTTILLVLLIVVCLVFIFRNVGR